MRAVIAAQPATVSPLVFASETTGRAFNGWGKSVIALQRAAGVTFTPHDLRRTCRTLMSCLGVEPDIAELAIGHKRTGLDRLYNFDQAWQLCCDAFAKVSAHVATLIDARAGAPGMHQPIGGSQGGAQGRPQYVKHRRRQSRPIAASARTDFFATCSPSR